MPSQFKTYFLARTHRHFKTWLATCPYKFRNPVYVTNPEELLGLHNNFQIILLAGWFKQKTKAFNQGIRHQLTVLKFYYPKSVITEVQFKKIAPNFKGIMFYRKCS